jgi:hypothetical protein
MGCSPSLARLWDSAASRAARNQLPDHYGWRCAEGTYRSKNAARHGRFLSVDELAKVLALPKPGGPLPALPLLGPHGAEGGDRSRSRAVEAGDLRGDGAVARASTSNLCTAHLAYFTWSTTDAADHPIERGRLPIARNGNRPGFVMETSLRGRQVASGVPEVRRRRPIRVASRHRPDSGPVNTSRKSPPSRCRCSAAPPDSSGSPTPA